MKRTEQILAFKDDDLSGTPTDEFQSLLQELRTHQIELELQNEELLRTQVELLESRDRYANLYNSAPVGYVTVNSKGMIIEANLTLVEMLDFDKNDLLNNPFSTCIFFDDQDIYYSLRHLILTSRNKEGNEIRLQKKSGAYFWVRIDGDLVLGAEKETDEIQFIIKDISARKQVEEKLASEQEKLNVTLQSIADGVVTTDTQGTIILLNRIAEKLTGWSQDEAIGRFLQDVFNIININNRQPVGSLLDNVLKSGMNADSDSPMVLIAKDGKEQIVAESCAPVRDKKGNIIGFVWVFRDITEKHKMQQELIKTKKLESVGVLAGGIAHDFNNILASILGNIDLAEYFLKPDEEKVHKLLKQAKKASLRAKDLTYQLLTFSKGGEPVKKIASITEVIKETCAFVLQGSNVKCEYHFPADLWPVEIDTGQMSQVIQNLIFNAIHAMPEGGIITIDCENISDAGNLKLPIDKGRYVRISIQDSGVGIPAEQLDKIFDPFYTTKKEGSGLGLAITHSIILQHGGYIAVESKPGKGTTFILYLAASVAQQIDRQLTPEPVKTGGNKGRALIMDDEDMVRELARGMLTHLGYEVVLAKEGREALTIYKESRETGKLFDIVIMDLTIPGGMGGVETTKKLLAFDPLAKVIVASGYSNDPVMSNYKDYGFAGVMIKPYLMIELRDAIHDVLKD